MQDLLQQVAGVICVIAYVFLIIGINKPNMEQSFAAFLLWGMLDTIAMITSIFEQGNYWLPLSNSVGASLVAILLIAKKQVVWTWVESLTAALVVICLIVWGIAGERAGLIASSIAVLIASVPQMIDTYKRPQSTPTIAYAIFLFADVLSVFAGKGWTIEERFYSVIGGILSIVILVFSLKKSTDDLAIASK
jgi:hypothetical protein